MKTWSLVLFGMLLVVSGCTAGRLDLAKVEPTLLQACQHLPVLATSVRMAQNYVGDAKIKQDLATAAMVLNDLQKLCPPVEATPTAPAITP